MSTSDLSVKTMYRILSPAEKKKLESPLLLGATYNLNNSETKKISVGLQPRVNGEIVPIVKLQNNNSSGGIVFESSAWSNLQDCYGDISAHFKKSKKYGWKGVDLAPATPLRIEDFEVFFTTAFGSKAIVFDRVHEESTTEESDDDNLESQLDPPPPPPKKKKCNYSPAVVMQKISFDGLCNVTVCVEERFRRLQRFAPSVKTCIDTLCAELILHIPANESSENVNEDRIKELFTHNAKSLHDAVQHRMDPSFYGHLFDVLFVELKVFCIPFITNEVKKILEMNKKELSTVE